MLLNYEGRVFVCSQREVYCLVQLPFRKQVIDFFVLDLSSVSLSVFLMHGSRFSCAEIVVESNAVWPYYSLNPLRPSSDPSQTSHCNIKGLSVSQVMRIEYMITQVKFY